MGTSLNGLTPANTYQGLIKFGDNSALTSVLKALSDGNGNDTMLELSTTALQIGGSTGMYWDNTNKRLGVGFNTPTARLHVKGSGTTFATNALLVQNSDGTELLRVIDQSNNGAVIMPTAKIGTFTFVSSNVIDNTSIRLVSTTGGVSISHDYASAPSGTLLHVKGRGSTSATTALLVQNSAGNTALTVADDRTISTSGGDVSLRDGALFVASNRVVTYRQVIGFFGNPVASAIVEIQSTTMGFLLPRMTTTQKNAIASPAAGLQVYDTTLNQMSYYNGSSWINF
jgi:hypothetical protein